MMFRSGNAAVLLLSKAERKIEQNFKYRHPYLLTMDIQSYLYMVSNIKLRSQDVTQNGLKLKV